MIAHYLVRIWLRTGFQCGDGSDDELGSVDVLDYVLDDLLGSHDGAVVGYDDGFKLGSPRVSFDGSLIGSYVGSERVKVRVLHLVQMKDYYLVQMLVHY